MCTIIHCDNMALVLAAMMTVIDHDLINDIGNASAGNASVQRVYTSITHIYNP